MVRKYHMWIVAGTFLMFSAGLAVAGSMERSDADSSYSARFLEAETDAGQPEAWQVNEPVETGAVPDTLRSPIESGIHDDPAPGLESDRYRWDESE